MSCALIGKQCFILAICLLLYHILQTYTEKIRQRTTKVKRGGEVV